MAKFSVVVIAKNEEETLPKLIASVKGADEIVVCDTGSTDRTIEVALELGAKVVENTFSEIITPKMAKTINALSKKHGEQDIVKAGDTSFNFSKARNWAATQAKNDYVFMPDCDEIVEWDVKEVEGLLDGVDRLEYNFIFAFDDKGNPLIQFLHSKFYNRKKFHWLRQIHEILVPLSYTNNIEGWMTDPELNFLHELAKQYKTIAEIGSWKGRSTNALASGCKGKVTAIDHFEGSADKKDGTHGAVGVYEEFKENTKKFKNIEVLKMSADEAAKKDKTYEMVFIDGEHTYEAVKHDIETWLPKATKIICGHDYSDTWPEVKRAVEEKFGPLQSIESIWFKVLEGGVPDEDKLIFKNVFTQKILLKHYQNPETSRTQYLKGLAIDNYKNEYNDRNAHYYARELMYRGWPKSALEMFKRHIDNPGWLVEKGQSYIYMGSCYEKMGNIKGARQCYLLSMELEPNRREAYLALALSYYNKKMWRESERLYRTAIDIPKTNYYANVETNYGHYPFGQMAVCLFQLGKRDESLVYLKKALAIDPENPIYKNNLKYY